MQNLWRGACQQPHQTMQSIMRALIILRHNLVGRLQLALPSRAAASHMYQLVVPKSCSIPGLKGKLGGCADGVLLATCSQETPKHWNLGHVCKLCKYYFKDQGLLSCKAAIIPVNIRCTEMVVGPLPHLSRRIAAASLAALEESLACNPSTCVPGAS